MGSEMCIRDRYGNEYMPDEVLNDLNSAMTDSFVDDLLDAPYFTRPNEIDGLKVPDVLLSGDHKAIEKWRNDKKLEITKDRRPDLLKKEKKWAIH